MSIRIDYSTAQMPKFFDDDLYNGAMSAVPAEVGYTVVDDGLFRDVTATPGYTYVADGLFRDATATPGYTIIDEDPLQDATVTSAPEYTILNEGLFRDPIGIEGYTIISDDLVQDDTDAVEVVEEVSDEAIADVAGPQIERLDPTNEAHIKRAKKALLSKKTLMGRALSITNTVGRFFAALGVALLYLVTGAIAGLVDLGNYSAVNRSVDRSVQREVGDIAERRYKVQVQRQSKQGELDRARQAETAKKAEKADKEKSKSKIEVFSQAYREQRAKTLQEEHGARFSTKVSSFAKEAKLVGKLSYAVMDIVASAAKKALYSKGSSALNQVKSTFSFQSYKFRNWFNGAIGRNFF